MAELRISPIEAEKLVEKAKRQTFSLDLFRSLANQDDIFTSNAVQLCIKGGNRAGKTLCAAVLFAAIATDSYITLSNGTRVRARRPHQVGRKLRMYIIAYDTDSIGRVIYDKLFRRGAFKIIRDLATGVWRAFDYRTDKDRLGESRDSDPLIPARYVVPKSWTWEQKSSKIFRRVELHDPITKEPLAEIFCYSSKSESRPQGQSVDAIWVDEQLYNGGLEELAARLPDAPRGRLWWSSWPRSGSADLRMICEKAKEDRGKENPIYGVVTLRSSDNSQMDEEGKQQWLASLSEEERLARDYGEFVTEHLKMYPLFDPEIHCAYRRCAECMINLNASCSCKLTDDPLAAFLRASRGQPGSNWTRELALDPGSTNPAVLFCAVPPPELGNYLVVYDELYPGRKDATQLANLVKQKIGFNRFNRFIIDYRAGRQTPMGFNYTVKTNYEDAFRRFNIKCAMSGNLFTFGSDNVGGRIMSLQSTMHLNSDGKPKLRIVTGACPNLCKQLMDIEKDEVNEQVIDDRPSRYQKIDLHDCLCYWIASLPMYVKPDNSPLANSAIYSVYQKMKARWSKTEEDKSPAWGAQYSG